MMMTVFRWIPAAACACTLVQAQQPVAPAQPAAAIAVPGINSQAGSPPAAPAQPEAAVTVPGINAKAGSPPAVPAQPEAAVTVPGINAQAGSPSAAPAQPAAAITDRFASPAVPVKATIDAAKVAADAVASPNPGITALPELAAEGYWIENAPLNEVFQYLARASGSQYYFNNDLIGPQFNVTGHLKLTDPKKQMEQLAVGYGLTVHEQGSTVYLMNDAQLAKLPVEVMCYQLKYLRGAHPASLSSKTASADGGGGGGGGGGASGLADFEKLKAIIKPLLTHDTGQIEFEEKTNVLLVTDNSVKLQRVHQLLEELDRPKQQIMINVRILRVSKVRGSQTGVDWTSVLGTGLPISASQSLNALFHLPDSSTLTKALAVNKNSGTTFSTSATGIPVSTSTGSTSSAAANNSTSSFTNGTGLVFTAVQMEAIVHALSSKTLVSQESCPTVITEDNEQGIISIVDRYPVITTTVTATTAGQTATDQVRYKIDEKDPDASREPEKSREIGVTLSVTPTLLPDGTVRMKLRPRVANIVELITGKSGNIFPRVSESTIEGISRIPKGQSLFLGGFYDTTDSHAENKVPILGSLPLLNHLFSYTDKKSEQMSLVFIITPKVYDASDAAELPAMNSQTRLNSGFNRTNPEALVTPLLPEAGAHNDFLPVPVNRESLKVVPPPGDSAKGAAPQGGPAPKRTWLGRLFNKDAPPPGP